MRRKALASVRVVSYNVLADCNKAQAQYAPPSVVTWPRRSERLLKEIFAVDPDLICLQDVDMYVEWWRPKLSLAGYDTIFKQRTKQSGSYREGVLVGWRRDTWQMFRSQDIEFNTLGKEEPRGALAARALVADNVATMVQLQPWGDSLVPTGICLCCAQLSDSTEGFGEDLRLLQTQGLVRTLEVFNSDFGVPVVVCGGINSRPYSRPYEVLCNGLRPLDPGPPGPSGKPIVTAISTSAVRIEWEEAELNPLALDPLVTDYCISWCAGCNRFLGFNMQKVVRDVDCIVYETVVDEAGRRRSQESPLRVTTITGLSSGISYEFRVAGVNELGRGEWGEISEPLRMPCFAENEPEDRVLLGVEMTKRVRSKQLKAISDKRAVMLSDPRGYRLKKLVGISGVPTADEEQMHPYSSASGFTPRYADGSLNDQQATFATYAGYPLEPRRTSASNLHLHMINGEDDSAVTLASTITEHSQEYALQHCDQSFEAERDTETVTTAARTEESLFGVDNGTGSATATATATDTAAHSTGLETDESIDPCHEEMEMTREMITKLGVEGNASDRQEHSMGLRSAYQTYSMGGEPHLTSSTESQVATLDYIFSSGMSLIPGEILSLPELGELVGCDALSSVLAVDTQASPHGPSTHCAAVDNTKGYMGEWMPYLEENRERITHFIPNETFSSSHLMLMAQLYFVAGNCASTWH
ncbi:unnamed protein product [Chrysoparadoxa australica]